MRVIYIRVFIFVFAAPGFYGLISTAIKALENRTSFERFGYVIDALLCFVLIFFSCVLVGFDLLLEHVSYVRRNSKISYSDLKEIRSLLTPY